MGKAAKNAKKAAAPENPIVVFRERFVFNKATGAFFTISPEGAFILGAAWRGLDQNAIEKEVMARFGVPKEVATSDTERFMLRLEEMQLLPGKRRAER